MSGTAEQDRPETTVDEAARTAGEMGSLDLVIELPVRLSVEIGRKRLSLREVLSIGDGSVIELDRDANAAADVLVNGRLIARGDVTSVDERLAVRIVEVVQPGRGRGED